MLIKYNIEQIVAAVGGTAAGDFPTDEGFYLVTDSRNKLINDNILFFAIKGPKHNGHHFISSMIEASVKNFVVEKLPPENLRENCFFIVVKNTLKALQALAAYHRQQVKARVIGITGSNGKTIVKEWIYRVLKDDYAVFRSPKSYNSQIGVALSVLQIQKHHSIAIIEAGISTTHEMDQLEAMIKPEIGIFTNLGTAHNDGFDSLDQKFKEKYKLFQEAKLVIYNADAETFASEISSESHPPALTWSLNGHGNVNIDLVENEANERHIKFNFGSRNYDLSISNRDEIYVENLCQVAVTAAYLGVNPKALSTRIDDLFQLSARLEKLEGKRGCQILNDAYSADLISFRLALNSFDNFCTKDKRTIILGDFEEDTREKDALYCEIGALILKHGFSRLIFIGKDYPWVVKVLDKQIETMNFSTVQDLLDSSILQGIKQEGILIKGAHDYQLSKVADSLAQKTHQSVLEIDLHSIGHNLRVFASFIPAQTKSMVMVKSGSYGSGLVELAKFLQYSLVDYLGVAFIDEGIELRQNGITLPILVLNVGVDQFDSMAQNYLEPEIFSIYQLEALGEFLKLKKSRNYPIHLKFDTGMHRLGFVQNDILTIQGSLFKYKEEIKVIGIMSHLAASSEPEHVDYTNEQGRIFKEICDSMEAFLGYKTLKHLLNSGGISLFPDLHFDLVRIGIGLYGIDGNPKINCLLEPAHQLKTFISQIRDYPAGTTIGYSRRGVLSRDSRIATIGIGYGDGLLRHAGNGNFSVMVKGKKAPIIGSICMDMCMIDVSDIPNVQLDDEVIIFNKEYPIDNLARALDTIPYEVLTGISPRIRRVYIDD